MNEKGERLMFGLFHKKEQKALELGAPVSGQAVPLQAGRFSEKAWR